MKLLLGLFVLCIIPLAYASPLDEKQLPPTNAFQILNGTGGNVTANKYNDFITFVEGTGMTIGFDYALSTITFSAAAGGLVPTTCAANNFFYEFNGTHFLCDVASGSGENNTASNLSPGTGLFASKVGVDLQFKSLLAGDNISLTSNSTTITINATSGGGGEANTASNVGTGEGSIFKQKTGVDLEFKTLKNATGIIITNNTSDITFGTSFFANSETCSGSNKISSYNNMTGVFTCTSDVDTGEANTSSNLNEGVGIFNSKVGQDLQFKSLLAGDNISLTSNSTNIWINATGGAGDNLGDHIATTDLTMGTNYIDITEIADPGTPSSDTVRLFAFDTNGNTRFRYNLPDGTEVQVARDNYYIARNTSGGTIDKCDVVYVTGSTGQRPNIDLARANSDTSMPATGYAGESISNNGFGRVMFTGVLDGCNTNGISEGSNLWVSDTTAGDYTSTKPNHPNYSQRIGTVLNEHTSNGSILVNLYAVRGDHEGTNLASWKIGDDASGTKSLIFRNGFDYTLQSTPTADRIVTLPDKGGTVAFLDDIPGGGGEANTASNLGTVGEGLFTTKSGIDLPFKKLVAGDNITLDANGTRIMINATGGAGDNLGDHIATQDLVLGNNSLNTINYEIYENSNQIIFATNQTTGSINVITTTNTAGGDANFYASDRNAAGTDGAYVYLSVLQNDGAYLGSGNITGGIDIPIMIWAGDNFNNAIFNTDGSTTFNYDVDINANNLNMTEKTAPSTPASNNLSIYAKDKSGVSNLYFKDDAGVEHDLGATGGTNALLDGTAHTDTVAQTVSRGSIIYGDSTPKWNELTIGTSGQILKSDGTDIVWGNKQTLVASWSQSQTKTNIGTAFVDVYTQTNSNGKAMFIDTTGYSDVRLQIEWNKIGGGTQSCQLVDIASGTNILVTLTVVSGSNDSGFVDIPSSPALENVEKNYKLQCKSTTAADDPVFESAAVWLR